MSAEETCRLAQNLARNCFFAVFPCAVDKRPTLKGWRERAATDAEAIERLWRDRPGPLIGIACGERSGVSVLDIDRKHAKAVTWWQEHCARLLPTRTFETRTGGLHLYLQHVVGVRNSQGKICKGIDTRGTGGFAIFWFAAGFGCFDHSQPAPWPAWLLEQLTRPSPADPLRFGPPPKIDRALAGLVRRVAAASEGQRNGTLFWAACRAAERGLRQSEVEALLVPAAISSGLHEIEARRTIGSASGRAAT